MSIHRTAMGKPVDMSALSSRNEKTRAVGNMNVNARGDVIDSFNRVIQDNTQRVKSSYRNTIAEDQPDHLAPGSSEIKRDMPKAQTLVEDETPDLTEEEQKIFDEFDSEEDTKEDTKK